MLAWVVIYRPHPRRSPLSRRSFHLSSHLSLFTVVHALSVQQLTKCSSRNSFVFKTIHFDGGGVYSTCSCSNVSTCFRAIPFPIRPLRTLLHFFALSKNSTLFFSSASALFAKNHPGVGGRGQIAN